MMREAQFYTKEAAGIVRCLLCPHACRISEGGWGICRTRQNVHGVLQYLYYGRLIAEHVDPVEKKPLYHFLPGSATYSIASPGCNLQCGFCQNWEISQIDDPQRWATMPISEVSADELIVRAQQAGAQSISYTYTEPTMMFEYIVESAALAQRKGLRTIMVSNGYVNSLPLKKLLPYVDAFNIDLKSMDEAFYSNVCKAHRDPVLETLRMIIKEKRWLEVTTLLIPGLNTEPEQIQSVIEFVKAELGPQIPLHFSGFYPTYRLTELASTSAVILRQAHAAALKAGLQYVYTGNVRVDGAEHTYCPSCKEVLIKRRGFSVVENNVRKGACRFCSEKIAGFFVDNQS